jgi:hypothetical protein
MPVNISGIGSPSLLPEQPTSTTSQSNAATSPSPQNLQSKIDQGIQQAAQNLGQILGALTGNATGANPQGGNTTIADTNSTLKSGVEKKKEDTLNSQIHNI